MIIDVQTLQQLKEETSNSRVLIDVWATWCGPCKMMSPILYDVDQEFIKFGKEFKIIKIDADNGDFADFLRRQGIKSIPTFLVYENESVIDTVIGALPKNKFIDFVLKNF